MINMGGDKILTLVLKAGLIVKFVLLVLLSFSVFSWAIIFYKLRLLSKAEKESEQFYQAFIKSSHWESLYQSTRKLTVSPLLNIFKAAYSVDDASIVDVKTALRRVTSMEAARLERYLTFLATTG